MRFNPKAFAAAQAQAAAAPADSRPEPQAPGLAPFIDLYGQPAANRITVPTGHLAVTLSLKFNDSAPQVDHFDHHARFGCPDFLVLLLKKHGRVAQTEHIARSALSLIPGLQRLDWQWHSERYTGGHGNYLQSSPFPLPAGLPEPHFTFPPRAPGLAPRASIFWEIEFTSSHPSHALELWPHKVYGQTPVARNSVFEPQAPGLAPQARVALNARFNGVEIHFSHRPPDPALAPLRADRAWRYSGKNVCWYASQTPQTIQFANDFIARFNAGDPVPVPDPRPETPDPTPVPVSTPTPAPLSPGRAGLKIIRFTP